MFQIRKIAPFAAMAVGAVLALASSAFKQVHTHRVDDPYTFEYTPPTVGDYSTTSVQNDSNWVYVPEAPECGGEDKACSLEVPIMYVNDPNGSPTLKSTINIVAALGSGGNAYVSATAAGLDATIDNQPD